MKLEIIKILAYGSNKRFMTFVTESGIYGTIRIPSALYVYLRDNGVPTAQYLRWHKND